MLDPLTQYKEQSINTMSRGELIVKLFDELLKNIKYAVILMQGKNDTASKKCTDKSKSILNYLSSSLDRKYEISTELYQLYSFLSQEIIKAEVKRDPAFLQAITPIVTDLRDTWAQAERKIHMK